MYINQDVYNAISVELPNLAESVDAYLEWLDPLDEADVVLALRQYAPDPELYYQTLLTWLLSRARRAATRSDIDWGNRQLSAPTVARYLREARTALTIRGEMTPELQKSISYLIRSELAVAHWKDPEARARTMRHWTEESRAALSQKMHGKWQTSTFRKIQQRGVRRAAKAGRKAGRPRRKTNATGT